MTDCIFCKIVAGEAPAYVVAEDARTVAFLDRGQATEGHTLVVSRSHASDLWEISEEDAAAVMVMAKRVAHTLEQRLAPDGLNLIQSNRPAGWALASRLRAELLRYTDGAELVASAIAFRLGGGQPSHKITDELVRAGFAVDDAEVAASVLVYFVLGYTTDEQQHRQAAALGAVDGDADLADVSDDRFARGLSLIIVGIEHV